MVRSLTLDEYQDQSAEFDYDFSHRGELWYYVVGLAGEVGELAEKVKKHYRDDAPLDLARLTLELGDIQWYLAAIARHAHVSLGAIAEANLTKLSDRARRGVLGGSGDER